MKENETIKAVIFDMDGLMLDTERPLFPIWKNVAETYGYKLDDKILIKTLGTNEEGTRKAITENFSSDFPYDKIRSDVSRLYREELDKGIAHKEGLLALLTHIKLCEIPMGVATSTRRESALNKLSKTGIIDYFKIIVAGNEVKNGKPAPDIFLKAAELLGQLPSLCMGFEDSSPGLQGLYSAGIRSIFIKDIAEPPPEVLTKVWKRYSNLAEAIELFK